MWSLAVSHSNVGEISGSVIVSLAAAAAWNRHNDSLGLNKSRWIVLAQSQWTGERLQTGDETLLPALQVLEL